MNNAHTRLAGIQRQAEVKLQALPLPSLRRGLTVLVDTRDFPAIASLPARSPIDAQARYAVADGDIFSLIQPKDKFHAYHMARADVQEILIENNSHAHELADAEPIVFTTSKPTHFVIRAKAGSRRTALIHTLAPADSPFTTTGMEVFLEEGAQLHLIHVHDHPHVHAFSVNSAQLGKGSTLHAHDLVVSGRTTLVRTHADLAGEGSSVKHKVLFLPDKGEQVDCEMTAYHAVPQTTSRLDVRGGVANGGRGVIEGTIHIAQQARESCAFQDMELLLLEKGAIGDAIPNLEIDNPEVRCTHAATIGNIDENTLYYLMSRGVTRADARQLLMESFFASCLEGVPAQSRELFTKKIMRMLTACSRTG
jgi:Fe-S cluster assembly scaffold protein SufB